MIYFHNKFLLKYCKLKPCAKVKAFDTLRFQIPAGDSESWLSVGEANIDVHSSDEEETTANFKSLFLKAAKPKQTNPSKQSATVQKSRVGAPKKRKASAAQETQGRVYFRNGYGYMGLGKQFLFSSGRVCVCALYEGWSYSCSLIPWYAICFLSC